MKYLCLIYNDEREMGSMPRPDGEKMMAEYSQFTEDIKKSGHYKGGDALQPSSTATTVRIANGKPQVLDGPYADTKEQFGGYFIIDVDDLDAAIAWASRCPATGHGVVEVRPLARM
jgi:hypothetical protein